MISRRQLIFAGGATFASPRAALAALQCRDYGPVRTCSVGLPVGLIAAAQQCLEWCWAACIQTIFDYHGYSVEQERIVQKLFGATACLPAIGPHIAYAIEGNWIDKLGDPFQARAQVLWDAQFGFGRPDAIAIAAQELARNNPLILGAMGHATVMTAMTYSGNGQFIQINEVIIRDPWPGNPNRRALSAQEALATQFLAAVRVT
jgi:hypothetical protein